MPSWSAAALDRSRMRPPTYGPRSLISTSTVLPFLRIATVALVPSGSLRRSVRVAAGRRPAVEARTVPGREALLDVNRLRPLRLSGFVRRQDRCQRKREGDTRPFEPLKHRFDLPCLFPCCVEMNAVSNRYYVI